mmetsp:Transcript_19607/g.78029  ORF Transcript_19607/g.78029 Transcript_19607/m.78029 type:complete len:224 (+) Transcript_19607:509-1180(+)
MVSAVRGRHVGRTSCLTVSAKKSASRPARGATSRGGRSHSPPPRTCRRSAPPWSSRHSRLRYASTVSLRPSAEVLSTWAWKRDPSPGYTASMASDRLDTSRSLGTRRATSPRTKASTALRRSRTPAKSATWLLGSVVAPPALTFALLFFFDKDAESSAATLALIVSEHGSTPPFSATVREKSAVAAALGCAPHIQSTLSPRTEGTTTCAPTALSAPTQISDAS